MSGIGRLLIDTKLPLFYCTILHNGHLIISVAVFVVFLKQCNVRVCRAEGELVSAYAAEKGRTLQ